MINAGKYNRSAPRVCGDDLNAQFDIVNFVVVLPAYAGMMPVKRYRRSAGNGCSPRMRG